MITAIAKSIVEHRLFQPFIIGVILFNAVLIGMETYPGAVNVFGTSLEHLDQICLWIFVIEIVLKIIALGRKPHLFFTSAWNNFDFIIVALAFVPGLQGQTTVLRLIRLLRVLRLLSAMPNMQIMIIALIHSIPRIGQMALMASLLFYIYAVIGTTLFAEHDPQHWGTLHISLLSLFRILTLEDWTDLMYSGMEAYDWAWVFHVSFVLLATFIIFNMLIGIILSSMEEARVEVEKENNKSNADTQEKLDEIKRAVESLEQHIKDKS